MSFIANLFLLLFLCAHTCKPEELPSFIHVCHRNDPNIKECLIASVEDIRPYLIKGVPEYNIPSLEPLTMKDFFAEEAAGMNLKISDVKTWGASDFFVRGLDVNMDTNRFVVNVDIPQLRIEASYAVDGKVLMVPVNGEGHMEMNLTEVSARSELQGELYEKDGDKHIKYTTDDSLKIHVGNGTIFLVNMNKEKVLMQILNDIVNKNFKMFMHEFMPLIEKKLSSVTLEIANAIVGPFTYIENMACTNLKKFLTNPPHLIKVMVLVGCVFVSMQQTMKCFFKLSNPPISTHYRFALNDSIRYPSITVCRRPAFKTQHFSKYGLRPNPNLQTAHAFQRFLFDRYSIKDFLNETTFNFSEIFGSYAYAGLGNGHAGIDIDSIQTIDRGRCFILTPRVNSASFGMSGGWFLYLKHSQGYRRTDTYGRSVSGFRLYLHDKRETLSSSDLEENSFVTYIYLESAETMQVHLDIKEYKKLPSRSSFCIEPNQEELYSKSRCLEVCFQKQLAEIGNCTLPWLYALKDLSTNLPQCSNFRDVRMLISGFTTYNRSRLLQNCDCPVSCNLTMYSGAIVNRRAVEERNFPDSMITMHYASNLVSLMDEKFGYDWNSFLADIGGSLGFLLGLSVVGTLGLLEKIILCIIKFRFKMKQKEQDVESQPTEVTSITSSRMSTDIRPSSNDERPNTSYHKKYSNSSFNENLYEDLNDFNNRSLKCYENTRVGHIERF